MVRAFLLLLVTVLAACDQSGSVVADVAVAVEAGGDLAAQDQARPDRGVPDLARDLFRVDRPKGYPQGAWSVTCGSDMADYALDVAVDAAGNTYVVGEMGATPLFCPGRNLHGKGGRDGFVISLDPSGKVRWGLVAGSTASDSVQEVAVDGLGRVYITGWMGATTTLGGMTVPAPGSNQGYVARLTSTGTVDWVRPFSDTGWSTGMAIDADSAGNLCITGRFNGKLLTGQSSSLMTVLVARLDAAGTWKALGTGTTGTDALVPRGVALDGAGGCLVGGGFRSELRIGKAKLSSVEIDAFFAGMDKAGNFTWAHQLGGKVFNHVWVMDRLESGEVVAGIRYWGSLSAASTTFSSNGDADALLGIFDASGKWKWAVSAGGSGLDVLHPARGKGGGLWSAGHKVYDMTLGPIHLPPASSRVAVLARMNSAGKFLWAAQASGTGMSSFIRAVVDKKGDVIVAGELSRDGAFLGVTGSAIKTGSSLTDPDLWVVKVLTGP